MQIEEYIIQACGMHKYQKCSSKLQITGNFIQIDHLIDYHIKKIDKDILLFYLFQLLMY